MYERGTEQERHVERERERRGGSAAQAAGSRLACSAVGGYKFSVWLIQDHKVPSHVLTTKQSACDMM